MTKNTMSKGEQAVHWVATNGGSFHKAAERFGISRQAVHQHWRRLYPDTPPPSDTEREQRIAEYRRLGATMTANQIAAANAVTPDSVRSFCNAHDIELTPEGIPDEKWDHAAKLLRSGKTAAEVAKESDIGYRSIRNGIDKGRLPPATSNLAGRRDHRCADASQFMERTGCSLDDAARQFSVSPPCLWSYRTKRGLRTVKL